MDMDMDMDLSTCMHTMECTRPHLLIGSADEVVHGGGTEAYRRGREEHVQRPALEALLSIARDVRGAHEHRDEDAEPNQMAPHVGRLIVQLEERP